MRSLLITAAMVVGLVITGCSSQGSIVTSNPSLTPQQAPTVAQSATTQATPAAANTGTASQAPVSTTATNTPRTSARTPAPVPTREDGLPVPAGARETKNVPDVVRTFLQVQLKGQRRIGQPTGYLVPRPPDEVMQQYQSDLLAQGWEAVPLTGNLPDNVKLIVAQKDFRAIIVFTTATNGDALVYIVTTQK